jgi:uncharacterized protein (TIGR02300 family)
VAKPELGIKRLCASCGAKFYDLSKTPIVCPKCSTVYEVTLPRAKSDGPRGAAAAAAAATVAEPEAAEAETVSLEEADAEASGHSKTEVPESVDDIEVDEPIEDDDDDDSTFIADEEEGDDDVTDIIGDVSDDEET